MHWGGFVTLMFAPKRSEDRGAVREVANALGWVRNSHVRSKALTCEFGSFSVCLATTGGPALLTSLWVKGALHDGQASPAGGGLSRSYECSLVPAFCSCCS